MVIYFVNKLFIFLEQYIYFVKILRLKFAKFHEHFRNKPKAENLKRLNFVLENL